MLFHCNKTSFLHSRCMKWPENCSYSVYSVTFAYGSPVALCPGGNVQITTCQIWAHIKKHPQSIKGTAAKIDWFFETQVWMALHQINFHLEDFNLAPSIMHYDKQLSSLRVTFEENSKYSNDFHWIAIHHIKSPGIIWSYRDQCMSSPTRSHHTVIHCRINLQVCINFTFWTTD